MARHEVERLLFNGLVQDDKHIHYLHGLRGSGRWVAGLMPLRRRGAKHELDLELWLRQMDCHPVNIEAVVKQATERFLELESDELLFPT